jgi:hypothetical protein
LCISSWKQIDLSRIFDVDAKDDEVGIVLNFAFDFERLEPCPPSVFIANPSSDPTLSGYGLRGDYG